MTGQVALGGETRIVLEPGDEVVDVYYLLDIVNNAQHAGHARHAVPLRHAGRGAGHDAHGRLVAAGEDQRSTRDRQRTRFRPDARRSRWRASSRSASASLDIVQTFPVTLERLAVLVKKVGDTKLASAQIERQQDIPNEGQVIIGAMGGAVAAGQPIVADAPQSAAPQPGAAVDCAVAGRPRSCSPASGPRRVPKTRPRAKASASGSSRAARSCSPNWCGSNTISASGRVDRAPIYASRREDLVTSLEQRVQRARRPGRPGGRRRLMVQFDEVRLVDVSRHFGRRRAVSQISLTVRCRRNPRPAGTERRGQVHAHRHARDAGRTHVRQRDVRWSGTSRALGASLRRTIGLLAHELHLYPELSARQNLDVLRAAPRA